MAKPLTQYLELYDNLLKELERLRSIVNKEQDRRKYTSQVPVKQTQIAQNVSPITDKDTEVTKRIKQECIQLKFNYAIFKQVPTDYYDRSLEERMNLLGAPTVDHLCKSLIMENTRFQGDDYFGDRNNCKYDLLLFILTLDITVLCSNTLHDFTLIK